MEAQRDDEVEAQQDGEVEAQQHGASGGHSSMVLQVGTAAWRGGGSMVLQEGHGGCLQVVKAEQRVCMRVGDKHTIDLSDSKGSKVLERAVPKGLATIDLTATAVVDGSSSGGSSSGGWQQ